MFCGSLIGFLGFVQVFEAFRADEPWLPIPGPGALWVTPRGVGEAISMILETGLFRETSEISNFGYFWNLGARGKQRLKNTFLGGGELRIIRCGEIELLESSC